MYEVKINNKFIYFPGDTDYTLSDATLKLEVGNSGELSLTIPSTNPILTEISERSIVTVYKNEVEYWRGDIREITTDFLNNKVLYCVEDLAFLGEVVKYTHSITATYTQYFQNLINEYNAIVNDDKKFEVGYIQKSPGVQKTFEYETMSILELLREVADDYYVRVRRANGHRYIDIVSLDNYGKSNNQAIEFGENLMDFVKESNTSWLLSAIMPLGEELDEEIIPDVNDRVNISSVNDGSKVLINATALAKYGYIEKIVEFDGITSPSELKTEATKYLNQNSQPRLTMEVKAIDLSMVENVHSFELGDVINVICDPFGIDQNITLCEMEENLLDPTGNEFTLSSEVSTRSFTDIQNKVESEVKNLPTKSEVLLAAQKNALKLLNGNEGGYVSFVFDEDGKSIKEMIITDQPTEEKSFKKWVWNLSGLGYMKRSNLKQEWTDLGVAMTMNGEIVADYITTGQMSADHIRGGDLVVGGSDYLSNGSNNPSAKGTIKIKNANNTEVASLDRSGLKFYSNSGSSWFCPDGISDPSVASTTTLKIDNGTGYAFRVDTAGIVTAHRMIVGEDFTIKNWGTDTNWSALIGGSLWTHANDSTKDNYYGMNFGDLKLWLQQFFDDISSRMSTIQKNFKTINTKVPGIGMDESIGMNSQLKDLIPITSLEAKVFNR